MRTAKESNIRSTKAAIKKYKRKRKDEIKWVKHEINDAVKNGNNYTELFWVSHLCDSTEEWLKKLGYSIEYNITGVRIGW